MTGGTDPHRASRPNTARPTAGTAAVVAAAAVWGTTGTATSFAPGVPAFVFGAVTFGLGGLVMTAIASRPTRRALRDRAVRRSVVVGAAALAVYAVVFYAALAGAGVALGTTIAIGTSPAFAGLVEWGTAGRRVTGRWVVATVVGVAGMALVTIARADGAVGGALVLGIVAALAAGFTYALYSWAVADALASDASTDARGVVGAVFGLAAVPLVVVAVGFGGPHLGVAGNWPVFLYLAIVPTVVGHTLYAVGLGSVRASSATLLSLLEPVVAAVLAVLVVGEHLGGTGWAGVALVVVGLAVLALPVPLRTRAAGHGPSGAAPSR